MRSTFRFFPKTGAELLFRTAGLFFCNISNFRAILKCLHKMRERISMRDN